VCWLDDYKTERLCLDLIKKITHGKLTYEPNQIVRMMNEVHKDMTERNCISPCFRRALIYVTLECSRLDILALLMSDKESCKVNSSSSCEHLSSKVLTVLEHQSTKEFLYANALRPCNSADQLYEVLCEDIQGAVRWFYVRDDLQNFKLIVSHQKELEKRR